MGAIRNSFEQTEEGDLVWCEAGVSRRGGTDLRDVDGAACECREYKAISEGFVACEAERRLGS